MRYHSRKFLNEKQGMAAIEVVFERSSSSIDGDYVDCNVKISDCNRQVTLELYGNSRKSIAASKKKLNLLIDELTKLRDVYENPSNSRLPS